MYYLIALQYLQIVRVVNCVCCRDVVRMNECLSLLQNTNSPWHNIVAIIFQKIINLPRQGRGKCLQLPQNYTKSWDNEKVNFWMIKKSK